MGVDYVSRWASLLRVYFASVTPPLACKYMSYNNAYSQPCLCVNPLPLLSNGRGLCIPNYRGGRLCSGYTLLVKSLAIYMQIYILAIYIQKGFLYIYIKSLLFFIPISPCGSTLLVQRRPSCVFMCGIMYRRLLESLVPLTGILCQCNPTTCLIVIRIDNRAYALIPSHYFLMGVDRANQTSEHIFQYFSNFFQGGALPPGAAGVLPPLPLNFSTCLMKAWNIHVQNISMFRIYPCLGYSVTIHTLDRRIVRHC